MVAGQVTPRSLGFLWVLKYCSPCIKNIQHMLSGSKTSINPLDVVNKNSVSTEQGSPNLVCEIPQVVCLRNFIMAGLFLERHWWSFNLGGDK
jgi:hypothetical protein